MSQTPTATESSPPRVLLLTSPGLLGAEIINRFAACGDIHLVGIGLTARLYKNKGLLGTALTLYRRAGWRYLSYGAQESTVAWTRLRASGRPSGLKRVGGQVRPLREVNAAESIAWMRELAPDYVASFFFNQWIGQGVRAVPTRGAVNLHPSLLPALRGPDPIFRTLERGLTTSGYTIHAIADEFDAGQILHQHPRPVPQGLSEFGLYRQTVREGAELFVNWLAGKVASVVPKVSGKDVGDYCTFPTPDEVRAFLRGGHRLIDAGELRRALAEIE
ncbi:MAG: formyltransferase family protein [Planctomycetales bacterium]